MFRIILLGGEIIHMARFCPLYSGSSGNSTFIGDSNGGILVDAGVSCKSIVDGLREIGQQPEQIKSIFITHEHSDHIKGLKVFLKKYPVSVISSEGTLNALVKGDHIPRGINCHVIQSGGVEVHGIQVNSFPTSHDTSESVGYRMVWGERKMAVVTDLGKITDEVREAVIGCDLVMLESNYDKQMLSQSSYPYFLKRRIQGEKGHLSNDDCGEFVADLIKKGATRFYLAHLSNENNTPSTAYDHSINLLSSKNMVLGEDYILDVASRYKPSKGMSF